jgi:hypothetical protein
MTDVKERLAAVLASPRGKAMIEEGQNFCQAAFAQILAEADARDRPAIEAAMNAVLARKAN